MNKRKRTADERRTLVAIALACGAVFNTAWGVFDRVVSIASGALVGDTTNAVENCVRVYERLPVFGSTELQNVLFGSAAVMFGLSVSVFVLNWFRRPSSAPTEAGALEPEGPSGDDEFSPPSIRGATQTLQGSMLTGVTITYPGGQRERPLITHEELTRAPFVRERTVIVHDIPRDERTPAAVRGRVFEDCIILGPAVVMFGKGTTVESPLFLPDENIEHLLWPMKTLPDGRTAKIGYIGFEACQLVRCVFLGVGITGTRKAIEEFRYDMKQVKKRRTAAATDTPRVGVEKTAKPPRLPGD